MLAIHKDLCHNHHFGDPPQHQVRNKANVNSAASNIGTTPLHLTALNNHPNLARYLCDARADKNVCAKKQGSTPLMMAVSR